MTDTTEKVIGTYWNARVANSQAKDIERVLNIARSVVRKNPELGVSEGIGRLLEANGIPGWARSVRAKRAGRFKHQVIVTNRSKEGIHD